MAAPDLCRPERSRLDKLGVKPGARVRLAGDFPADFLAELAGAGVQLTEAAAGLDLLFLAVPDHATLADLAPFREAVRPNGAVWAIWRKGVKSLNEDHIRAAALAQGLVDVKVIRFDEQLSGLKLVIPKAARSIAGRRHSSA